MSLDARVWLSPRPPCDLDAPRPRVEGAETQGLDDCLLGRHRSGEARRGIGLRVAVSAFRFSEQARLEGRHSLQSRRETRHVHHVDTDHEASKEAPPSTTVVCPVIIDETFRGR
jgi:hypothetical protein